MTSAAQEILGQYEIDALIHGMGSGDIPTEAPPARDEARGYDFGKNTRIVRGRRPTLEMINELSENLNKILQSRAATKA